LATRSPSGRRGSNLQPLESLMPDIVSRTGLTSSANAADLASHEPENICRADTPPPAASAANDAPPRTTTSYLPADHPASGVQIHKFRATGEVSWACMSGCASSQGSTLPGISSSRAAVGDTSSRADGVLPKRCARISSAYARPTWNRAHHSQRADRGALHLTGGSPDVAPGLVLVVLGFAASCGGKTSSTAVGSDSGAVGPTLRR